MDLDEFQQRNVSNNKEDEGSSARAVAGEDGEKGVNSGTDSEDDTDCEEVNVENSEFVLIFCKPFS